MYEKIVAKLNGSGITYERAEHAILCLACAFHDGDQNKWRQASALHELMVRERFLYAAAQSAVTA